MGAYEERFYDETALLNGSIMMLEMKLRGLHDFVEKIKELKNTRRTLTIPEDEYYFGSKIRYLKTKNPNDEDMFDTFRSLCIEFDMEMIDKYIHEFPDLWDLYEECTGTAVKPPVLLTV